MAYIDFKVAKSLVNMEMLLNHYHVPFQPKPQLYNLACPLPTHKAGDKRSLNVNLERNIWSCKSGSCVAGRNGREGGNVLDFVIAMEDCNPYEAAIKIVSWFGNKQGPGTTVLKPQLVHPKNNDMSLVDWLEKGPPGKRSGGHAG